MSQSKCQDKLIQYCLSNCLLHKKRLKVESCNFFCGGWKSMNVKESLLTQHLAWHHDTKLFCWQKMSIPMNLSSLSLSSTLGHVFIHVNFISWVKSKRFHRKVNSRCFCCLQGAILEDHRVSQDPIKVSEKRRQITQTRCTAQTWELERWLKDLFPTTFQVLGLFHWTVSNLFFILRGSETMVWGYEKRNEKQSRLYDRTAHLNFPPFTHNDCVTISRAFNFNPLRFEEKRVLLLIRELSRSFASGSLTEEAMKIPKVTVEK